MYSPLPPVNHNGSSTIGALPVGDESAGRAVYRLSRVPGGSTTPPVGSIARWQLRRSAAFACSEPGARVCWTRWQPPSAHPFSRFFSMR